MNNPIAHSRIIFLSSLAVVFFLSHLNAYAEELKTATITIVKNQVLIAQEGEKGRFAAVKDVLKSNE